MVVALTTELRAQCLVDLRVVRRGARRPLVGTLTVAVGVGVGDGDLARENLRNVLGECERTECTHRDEHAPHVRVVTGARLIHRENSTNANAPAVPSSASRITSSRNASSVLPRAVNAIDPRNHRYTATTPSPSACARRDVVARPISHTLPSRHNNPISDMWNIGSGRLAPVSGR